MPEAAGGPLPGSLLLGALGAVLTGLLALLLGAALLSRVDRSPRGLDAVLCWLVLGIPLQALVWLALGGLGALDAATLPSLAGVLALAAAWPARRPLLEAAAKAREALRERLRLDLATLAGAALIATFLLVVLGLALLPTLFHDDLVYHLGLPRQALLIGSWPDLPPFHYSYLPASWDASYLLSFSLGSAAGAQLLNWGVLGLLAVAAVRLARVAAGVSRGPALLAAMLFVVCPMTASLGAMAGTDLFVALALTVATTSLLGGEPGPRGAASAGLVAGAAWAAKYTALPALSGLFLAQVFGRRGEAGGRWRDGLVFGLAALLPALAWNLRAWALTGNPLYPAFRGVLGGRHWNAESAALVATDVAHGAVPAEGASAFFTAGWRLLTNGGGMGHPAGLDVALPWLGLAGLAGAASLPRRRELLLILTPVYVGWCLTSLNQRYGLFLLALLVPPAAALLERLVKAHRILGIVVILLAAASAHRQADRALESHLGFYHANGVVIEPGRMPSRREVLERLPLYRAGEALDALLPRDAGLLVIGEGRLALIPRPAWIGSAYDRPAVAWLLEGAPSPAVLTERARAHGISHVLVNFAELARWEARFAHDARLPPGGRALLARWTASELAPVGKWGPVEVWALPATP